MEDLIIELAKRITEEIEEFLLACKDKGDKTIDDVPKLLKTLCNKRQVYLSAFYGFILSSGSYLEVKKLRPLKNGLSFLNIFRSAFRFTSRENPDLYH